VILPSRETRVLKITFAELLRSCSRNISPACCGVCVTHGQRRELVSTGFASRNFLTSRLISRQVASSVYVGEKVSDPTQMERSAAGNVDQFLVSSSRVRCSLARQLVNLSAGVWPNAIEAAARQLAVTSQLGTPSATAARVRRAEASVGQNEMPSAEAAAMAIINRRNLA
jgi:hypothetical protein